MTRVQVFAALLGGLLMLAPKGAEATSATGGSVTNFTLNGTNYVAHTFTSNGAFTVSGGSLVCDVLVVGGGGGANHAGYSAGDGNGGNGGDGTNLAFLTGSASSIYYAGGGGGGVEVDNGIAGSGGQGGGGAGGDGALTPGGSAATFYGGGGGGGGFLGPNGTSRPAALVIRAS